MEVHFAVLAIGGGLELVVERERCCRVAMVNILPLLDALVSSCIGALPLDDTYYTASQGQNGSFSRRTRTFCPRMLLGEKKEVGAEIEFLETVQFRCR